MSILLSIRNADFPTFIYFSFWTIKPPVTRAFFP
jgi:hypothetical protein